MDQSREEPDRLVVIMGPSGSGKSTLAATLADATGMAFIEGDDHHSPANIAKMSSGSPLSDRDRAAWLDSLVAAFNSECTATVWLACSALTPYVQRRLRNESRRRVTFVMLELDRALLRQRLSQRDDHFIPAELLESQLAALAPPNDAIRIDGDQSIEALHGAVLKALDHKRKA